MPLSGIPVLLWDTFISIFEGFKSYNMWNRICSTHAPLLLVLVAIFKIWRLLWLLTLWFLALHMVRHTQLLLGIPLEVLRMEVSGWKLYLLFYILSMPRVYMKMHAGCFNKSLYRNPFIDCVYHLTVNILHNNMNEILQTVLAAVFNFKAFRLWSIEHIALGVDLKVILEDFPNRKINIYEISLIPLQKNSFPPKRKRFCTLYIPGLALHVVL